jgi:hypothetical protein
LKQWLRQIRGAVGMGLIWAAVWAAVGALIGIVDSGGSMNELWLGPAIGMYPGFLGGVMFSAVLGIVANRRRLDTLSLSKVVASGGMAGLLVGVLPFAINRPTSEAPLWLVGVVVIGSMTLLSAVSAAGSLALARRARSERR